MAQGTVTTNNLNLAQGETPAVEKKALFVGVGTAGTGTVFAVNTQTDLAEVLGDGSEIYKHVLAAQQNGGENWQAVVAPVAEGYNAEAVVNTALETYSVELVCICTPVTSAASVTAMHTFAEVLRSTKARRVIILLATAGVDAATETWADYVVAQEALQDGVAGYRVALVPSLHGNDLGVLAGRLCNAAVGVADSPMRVATGPVLGLGATPVDTDGDALSAATLAALDAVRLSCIQHYTDYPGTYWGDCNLLDAPGGDYQVIEHLRVVDKAARRIRVRQINRIANRQLNSTASSIENNRQYFMAPLREMARGQVFAGQQFPGDIHPPADDHVQIDWPTNTKCVVYFKVRPYNSPKTIEANILLDLSQPQ
ncbi:DUF2586 domain-containing protein [Gilvimarinus japonicus]|uniref:DUF2586 domain-containing protein n=1 Tax=Gilvimarinus japonicus TaxID=1796469 RepID=A0ABV7HN20_9GAMM